MNVARIFISYATEDRAQALEIYRYLLSCALTVWIDCECLLPGQNWRTEIEREISRSHFFLAVLSNNSINKRGYVQKELKIALEMLDMLPHGEIFLLPVRIEECRVEHPSLSSLHYIDMFGRKWKRGARYILKSIHRNRADFQFPKTALYMILETKMENYGPLLEAAIMARDLPALSLLLQRGADPADSTISYGSPLEFLLNEHEDDETEIVIAILQLFFRFGADPDQRCMHSSSLIAQLAHVNKAEVMATILEQGANVDFQDEDGKTCLMLSASWGSPECVHLLLKHGADVNLVDHEGRTAMMHACTPQHYDLEGQEMMAKQFVELLLARGANAETKDIRARTAADCAAAHGLYEVEAFLRARESSHTS
jgi:hypothetical protein